MNNQLKTYISAPITPIHKAAGGRRAVVFVGTLAGALAIIYLSRDPPARPLHCELALNVPDSCLQLSSGSICRWRRS